MDTTDTYTYGPTRTLPDPFPITDPARADALCAEHRADPQHPGVDQLDPRYRPAEARHQRAARHPPRCRWPATDCQRALVTGRRRRQIAVAACFRVRQGVRDDGGEPADDPDRQLLPDARLGSPRRVDRHPDSTARAAAHTALRAGSRS